MAKVVPEGEEDGEVRRQGRGRCGRPCGEDVSAETRRRKGSRCLARVWGSRFRPREEVWAWTCLPWLLSPAPSRLPTAVGQPHRPRPEEDLVRTPRATLWAGGFRSACPATPAAPSSHRAFRAPVSSCPHSASVPLGWTGPPPNTPHQPALLKTMPSSGRPIPAWMVLASPRGSPSTRTQPESKEIHCVPHTVASKSSPRSPLSATGNTTNQPRPLGQPPPLQPLRPVCLLNTWHNPPTFHPQNPWGGSPALDLFCSNPFSVYFSQRISLRGMCDPAATHGPAPESPAALIP